MFEQDFVSFPKWGKGLKGVVASGNQDPYLTLLCPLLTPGNLYMSNRFSASV